MSDTQPCSSCGHTNREGQRDRRLIVTVVEVEVDTQPLVDDDPGPELASDYCGLCVIGVLAEAERYGDAATLVLTPQTVAVTV